MKIPWAPWVQNSEFLAVQPENWNYFRSNLLLKLYTNLTPYSKKSIMKKSILKSRHSNYQLFFFFLINSQGKPLVGIAVSVSKTATWSNGFSWKLNLIIVQSFFFFFSYVKPVMLMPSFKIVNSITDFLQKSKFDIFIVDCSL